jgi:hypothetical protein
VRRLAGDLSTTCWRFVRAPDVQREVGCVIGD